VKINEKSAPASFDDFENGTQSRQTWAYRWTAASTTLMQLLMGYAPLN
jgi:hypothetical protein